MKAETDTSTTKIVKLDNASSVVRACQVCNGPTNSMDEYVCDECRNAILAVREYLKNQKGT